MSLETWKAAQKYSQQTIKEFVDGFKISIVRIVRDLWPIVREMWPIVREMLKLLIGRDLLLIVRDLLLVVRDLQSKMFSSTP